MVAVPPLVLVAVATATDSVILVSGGVLSALIGGAFAFAGVVYNARHQRTRSVKIDPLELERISSEISHERDRAERAELDLEHERSLRHDAQLELERWRSAALSHLSRERRRDRPE